MAFYGYKGDVGECHWTTYDTSSYNLFDVLPPESPLAYSAYEFNEPGLTDYSPYSYFDSYTPVQSVQNYYTCNLSEPRLLQYDPPPSYAVSAFYSQTNYAISDSNFASDLPEFEEYDPTPYDGGYDQIQTYGKPLPPSDEICYPPSSLQPKPHGDSLDGFSFASIPAAYGEKNEQPVKPESGSKPIATEEQKIVEGKDTGGTGSPKKPLMEEEPHDDANEHPSSDNGGYGYRQVPYFPYGSGLDSLDLPAGLFPKNAVKSFDLDGEGRLQVYLDKPCVAKIETRIFFDRVVRANLTYGELTGVEGLSQEELFLWLPVKDIIVYDHSSGLILFDIGLAYKQMSLSLFEDPPACKPEGEELGEENEEDGGSSTSEIE